MNALRLQTLVPMLLAMSGLLPSLATAHPFHVTIADADLNPETGRLEVALKVNPIDLEAALQKRGKDRVNLERTKDVDRRIAAWLGDVFRVRTRDGKSRRIEWVGKELEVKHAWLYFEIDVEGRVEGATVENRVFVNLLPRQENTIVLRDGKRQTTLQFTRERSKSTVRFGDRPRRSTSKAE